jgi:hypothetical protein
VSASSRIRPISDAVIAIAADGFGSKATYALPCEHLLQNDTAISAGFLIVAAKGGYFLNCGMKRGMCVGVREQHGDETGASWNFTNDKCRLASFRDGTTGD